MAEAPRDSWPATPAVSRWRFIERTQRSRGSAAPTTLNMRESTNDNERGTGVRSLRAPWLAMVLVALVGAACGDDEDKTASSASQVAASTTTNAEATSSGTATQPTSSSTPAPGRTVAPLRGGQQTPWTVKGSPDPFIGVVIVRALRASVHPELGGWERIVFEFESADRPPAVVQYVESATRCGSGQAVAAGGSATLEITLTGAQAHDNAGKPTLPTTLASPGGTVIIGGVSICDFEGRVTWAFALNGKHNFKVSTPTNPTRIVIDIKQ